MYLLDADVLITANRHDFPLGTNPGTFWNFLEEKANNGEIKIPEAVIEQIQKSDDDLAKWLSSHEPIFKVPTIKALPNLQQVLDAYGQPITEVELEFLNSDPYVIAQALTDNATVVSNEIRRPGATTPSNKKIPDICAYLNIPCIRYPRFLWEVSP